MFAFKFALRLANKFVILKISLGFQKLGKISNWNSNINKKNVWNNNFFVLHKEWLKDVYILNVKTAWRHSFAVEMANASTKVRFAMEISIATMDPTNLRYVPAQNIWN